MAQLRQPGYYGGGGNGASEQVRGRITHRQGGGRMRRPGHKGGGHRRVSVFAVTVTIGLGLLVSLSVFHYLFHNRELQGRLDNEREQDNDTKRAVDKEPRPRLDRSMAFKKLRFGKGSVKVGRDSRYWDRDDRRRDENYNEDSPELSSDGGGNGTDDHMADDDKRGRKAEQLVSSNGRAGESYQRKSRRRGLYNEAGRTELKEYEEKYEESLKKLGQTGEEGSHGEEVNSSDEYDDGFDIEDTSMEVSDNVEHDGRGHLNGVVDHDNDGDGRSGQTISSEEVSGTPKGKISRNTGVVSRKPRGNTKAGHEHVDGELAKSSSSAKRRTDARGKARHHRFSGCEIKFLNSSDLLVEPLEKKKFSRFSLRYKEKEERPDGEENWEPRFAGHQSLQEREESFYARDQKINCGFIKGPEGSPSTGFDLAEDDVKFMSSCHIAVSSCIFGNSDRLKTPTINMVRLRKVMHRSRFMRKSFIVPAIMNRIKRDLIHNPLHIILSVDVLGMTKSTFASLSKGFAELSTDVQFLQLRSKQVWSRRITGVGDGILQGTEAFAQGVAFGVSGVITKPVESTRERGVLGLPRGLGRAILGFIVQPVSGALDFVSLTVDGIGASCARCLELLTNKSAPQRIRNPRAIHANGLLKEYSEREATGQMILYLAEASRHLGCTNLFKEPSKYAWSDCYEDHFILPYQRILLITNKRVMLLLCLVPDKMDRKPCKIIWDVPWEEVMALELAKAGYPKPSHLIIHLKSFKRSESFVRLVKCSVEEEDDQEPQAVRICLVVRQTWKAHQLGMKSVTLRVPSRQRYVQFAWDETDGGDSDMRIKPVIRPRELTSSSCTPDDRRFVKHSVNFQKIWSSERDSGSRCTFCPKQVADDSIICSIWRPVCPDGYVPVGDVARVGVHPPNVAAVYRCSDGKFARPVGYDLVWRNCIEDYVTPVSIWSPRPPEGFISLGCVAVAGFEEPHPDSAYCVSTNTAEEALFEDQITWSAPESFPWACFIYQVQSEALHFVAMRQPKEETNWKPMRVMDHEPEEQPEARDQNISEE